MEDGAPAPAAPAAAAAAAAAAQPTGNLTPNNRGAPLSQPSTQSFYSPRNVGSFQSDRLSQSDSSGANSPLPAPPLAVRILAPAFAAAGPPPPMPPMPPGAQAVGPPPMPPMPPRPPAQPRPDEEGKGQEGGFEAGPRPSWL
jgi:hypothetical protein